MLADKAIYRSPQALGPAYEHPHHYKHHGHEDTERRAASLAGIGLGPKMVSAPAAISHICDRRGAPRRRRTVEETCDDRR